MTRLATTPAVIGILAVGMLAAGLAAGCGSNQVAIGSQNIDAAAGRGGALAGGSGGSATGGVVGSGGVAPTGGTVGVGGATPSGGIAGVGAGGSKASGGTTARGGSQAGGGTIATGGATGTGGAGSGGTTTKCAGLSESCVTSSCCAPLVCGNTMGSPICLESYPPPATGGAGPGGGSPNKGGSTATGGTTGTGGSTGTGGTGGSTGTTCGGLRGMSCATGEFCDLQAGSCNVSDATGTCVVKKTTGDCPVFDVAPPPVCGCDGKTYYDDCVRQAAGISKQADGACPTADAGVIMTPTLPAACQVDGDCCVAVDACTAMAYLVGRTEYLTMVASIPSVSSGVETCLRCIPPAVQVRCNGGFCAGEKLSISSSALTISHCGYVNVADAGTSTGSAHAAVDAGTAAGPSTWSCGN